MFQLLSNFTELSALYSSEPFLCALVYVVSLHARITVLCAATKSETLAKGCRVNYFCSANWPRFHFNLSRVLLAVNPFLAGSPALGIATKPERWIG